MTYKTRLLMYADILGWSSEVVADSVSNRLAEAMECIHAPEKFHNEYFRQRAIKQEESGQGRVNPIYLGVQFGSFSDHFTYSTPANFGSRILNTASYATRELLFLGFMTRGAVVIGDLVHLDNWIFGPALLEAVYIEENVSVYPRILISDAVLSFLDGEFEPSVVIKDQLGQTVVNPFALPFSGGDEAMRKSFFEMNHWFPTHAALEEQISTLRQKGHDRAADKWVYMRDFIDGPALGANPEIRRFWL